MAEFAFTGETHPSTQPVAGDDLRRALTDIFLHPFRTLIPAWSWKAAAISAFFRATFFLATSLHQGQRKPVSAAIVEAIFAVFAGGLLGAASQRLRGSHPLWATALVVWLLMPGIMLAAALAAHHFTDTSHADNHVLSSFSFAVLASAFTWYAMNRGALLGGDDSTSVAHDAAALPSITAGFVLAAPRALLRLFR